MGPRRDSLKLPERGADSSMGDVGLSVCEAVSIEG